MREYEMLTKTSVPVLSDRRRSQPYGRRGGGPGGRGRNTLLQGQREKRLPGKAQLELRAGDRLRIETPGGGGYGQLNRNDSLKGFNAKAQRRKGQTQGI